MMTFLCHIPSMQKIRTENHKFDIKAGLKNTNAEKIIFLGRKLKCSSFGVRDPRYYTLSDGWLQWNNDEFMSDSVRDRS